MSVEFKLVEYLGYGQALFQLPDNVRFGPASVGGRLAVNNLMWRIVDAHVRTGLIILGPLNEERQPTVIEPESEPDPDAPIKHDWQKDKDGCVIHHDLGEYHDGPQCVRCGEIFCRNCEPEKLDEPCEEQTPYLF